MRMIFMMLLAIALAMPVITPAQAGEGRVPAAKSEKKKNGKKHAKKKGQKSGHKKEKKGKKHAKKKEKKGGKKGQSERRHPVEPRVSAPSTHAPTDPAAADPAGNFEVPDTMKDDLPPPNNGALTE